MVLSTRNTIFVVPSGDTIDILHQLAINPVTLIKYHSISIVLNCPEERNKTFP